MLIEMLPDMPDCLADVVEWQPISYAEHFQRSGFKDADLTVRAYHSAPPAIRSKFDSLIADITISLIEVIKEVERMIEGGDMHRLQTLVTSQVRDLRSMIDEASGIINNSCRLHQPHDDLFDITASETQQEIDAILNAS